MTKFPLIVLLLSSLSIGGCTNKEIRHLQLMNKLLEGKVTQLGNDVAALQSKLDDYNGNHAVFTPDSKGYQRVETPSGPFLVALENLTKYADGYKAKLMIGNPSSATYNGMKVLTRWNSRFDVANETADQWNSSRKSSEVSLTNKILPGKWNAITVILSPATEDKVGVIEVSLYPSEILMAK